MTIAFRDADSTGTGSAANNITVSVPAGVVDGDLMLLCAVNSDSSDPADFNNPSGWSARIVDNLQTGGAAPSAPGMTVWHRVASSEPANYNLTTSPTASNGLIAFIVAFSGVDTTTPIDVTTTTATGDGSNADPPSIGSGSSTDGYLTVVGSWHDSTVGVGTGVPSGYTDSGESRVTGNGGGNGCTAQIAYRNSVIDPAAAENPGTFTTSAEQWGAFTIALRPAVGLDSVTPSTFRMNEDDIDLASSGGAFDVSGNDVYISDADTLAGSVNEVDISSGINTESTILINLDLTQLSAAEITNLHTLKDLDRDGPHYLIVNATGGEYSKQITLKRPIAFTMSLSSEFAPGSTTQRLTGLTGTFAGGRIEEALNPSATNTDVASDGNREDVWNIQATTGSREVAYVFRVLYDGEVPDTITQTPTVTISAATEFTMDAAAGSYAWTGTAANLEYHSAVDAASGSYAWTGTAANLEYHSAVDVESGSYAWTGTAADLEYHSALDAESGAYSWAGQTANLEYHSVIDAESGSYSWSGQDTSLLLSFIMAADTTSYAWTGQDIGFLLDLVLPVDSGSYAWTGTAANLEYHTALDAESANYTWTGQDVSLVQGFSVSAETVSYAWTGQTATLIFDALISAESGAYVWAGQDITLTYTQQNTLVADSGSYLWTGNAVTFLSDLVMETGSASYLWDVQDVTLTHNLGVAVSSYKPIMRPRRRT